MTGQDTMGHMGGGMMGGEDTMGHMGGGMMCHGMKGRGMMGHGMFFTVGAPPMNSAKGKPWAFTESRFLYLPPHHCFSVPVLKPQVQSHSIALGSGGGHNPMSLESQYRVWRSL